MSYIEVKTKCDKTQENGENRRVAEMYLVDALSCTEAESRVIEEVSPYVNGEIDVTSVKKSNVSEIFKDDNGDRYYIAKLNFVTLDEKTEVEKRHSCYILVQALDFDTAYHNLLNGMKDTVSDYEIVQLQETPIVDVYNPNSIARAKSETKI